MKTCYLLTNISDSSEQELEKYTYSDVINYYHGFYSDLGKLQPLVYLFNN